MANTSIGDTVAYAPLNPPEADGIKRKDDYYRWYFFGTREVLTASGLLPAGLLPPRRAAPTPAVPIPRWRSGGDHHQGNPEGTRAVASDSVLD